MHNVQLCFAFILAMSKAKYLIYNNNVQKLIKLINLIRIYGSIFYKGPLLPKFKNYWHASQVHFRVFKKLNIAMFCTAWFIPLIR